MGRLGSKVRGASVESAGENAAGWAFETGKEPTIGSAELPDATDFAAFVPFIKGVFSQWHPTPFEIAGIAFVTAEQWMMFAKARLFHDAERARQILESDDPGIQKRIGQSVSGFDQDIWDKWKIEIVYRGTMAKFGQNDGALRQLRNSGDAMLVEANPRDWVWGIGRAVDDPLSREPMHWRGQNLLGRILTKAREDLSG